MENGGGPSGAGGDADNLWSTILKEVQSRSSAALPQASVAVLGDPGSGKSSLVARLQRKDAERTGAGLEYHYLEVNPDFKDGSYAYQLGSWGGELAPGESGRLGVWVVGEERLEPLLKFALPSALLPHSAALLCVSLAQPWTIMESLRKWTRLLDAHLAREDARVVGQCREAQVRFWQEYVEPLDSSSHSEAGAKVPSMEADAVLLPLSDAVLSHNLGLPLVVVVTQADQLAQLDKDYGFKDEELDFIQSHLRQFCLSYGAALFYTSAKEGRNCEELYKYLLHRLFSFPFARPASVLHRDSVFIPAGWDNQNKIQILHEQLRRCRPDHLFEEHIKKPVLRRPQPKEQDVAADDDQAFLARAQTMLAQQPKQAGGKESSLASAADSPSHQPRLKTPSVSVAAPSPKLADQGKAATMNTPSAAAAAGGQDNQGVLAHFFNNLLTSKTGAGGGGVGEAKSPAAAINGGDDLSESQKADALARMSRPRQPDFDTSANSAT